MLRDESDRTQQAFDRQVFPQQATGRDTTHSILLAKLEHHSRWSVYSFCQVTTAGQLFGPRRDRVTVATVWRQFGCRDSAILAPQMVNILDNEGFRSSWQSLGHKKFLDFDSPWLAEQHAVFLDHGHRGLRRVTSYQASLATPGLQFKRNTVGE